MRVAKFFGTHRTPLSGGASRHTRSDTLHDRLFIEVKSGLDWKPVWNIYEGTGQDTAVIDDSEAGWMLVTHSYKWEQVRQLPLKDAFCLPGRKNHVKRKRCKLAGLFLATEGMAIDEKKVPMVALCQRGRKGFVIVVHSSWWDEARKIEGGRDVQNEA